MTSRRLGLLIGIVVAAALLGTWLARPPAIDVSPSGELQAILDEASPGTVVRLAEGSYEGPLVIPTRIALEGDGAVRISGPGDGAVLTVAAGGTSIRGLGVAGGESGISIRGVSGVTIQDVTGSGARLHGIEIVDAQADIDSVSLGAFSGDMAQGIEVRNSEARGVTTITNSNVSGAMEGIVAHVSRMDVFDSTVDSTTMRGIAVTEMSRGTVSGNRVFGAVGSGFYCGDMSRCEFSNNRAEGVLAGPGGRSTAGWGLMINYHANASSTDDSFSGEAGGIGTLIQSHLLDHSPFRNGTGWGTLSGVAMSLAVALGLMALAFLVSRRFVHLPRKTGGNFAWVVPTLLLGVTVQSFHMVEHVLQVVRVFGLGVPSRGGLLGPTVDSEWVHFTYNTAVLIGLLVIVGARRAGWTRPGTTPVADSLLVGAAAIQSWHLVEHGFRVTQHVVTGHPVNPGVIGHFTDLVWLHFTINVAVYLAFVAAAVLYLRRGRREPSARAAEVLA